MRSKTVLNGMTAVHDISFTVGKGEVFGLLGPNGAGKTTTLECLEGLKKADGGTLSVAGYDPWQQASSLPHVLGVQTVPGFSCGDNPFRIY